VRIMPIKSRLLSKADSASLNEYNECIVDLIQHNKVKSMNNYIQHGHVSTYKHCQDVSYISYLVCRMLKMDYCSAARGGLLHDLYLYDWHYEKPYKGMHGFMHPNVAFENANRLFCLNEVEKDIIQKHMWPLTLQLPRFGETVVVSLVDKCCATFEIFGNNRGVDII